MNNNKKQREILRLARKMNPEQKKILNSLLEDVRKLSEVTKEKGITKKQFTKALFIVDMNNGFVNFGAMANPKYNELVPEQLRLIEQFRREEQIVDFILEGHVKEAVEFLLFPEHCVYGTPEADLIPELAGEANHENSRIYYKNSINGALNLDLQIDLEDLKDLKEIVICGVCTDLCVLDFARTLARFMDEINHKVHMFVVASACSTFDGPGHDKGEETERAFHMMRAAGIEIVEDIEELNEREKVLGLRAA